MKLEDLTTIDQLEDFLSGTQAVAFSVLTQVRPNGRVGWVVVQRQWIFREGVFMLPVLAYTLHNLLKNNSWVTLSCVLKPLRRISVDSAKC